MHTHTAAHSLDRTHTYFDLRPSALRQHHQQQRRRRHPAATQPAPVRDQSPAGAVGADVLEDGAVPEVLLVRQHFGRFTGKLRRVLVALVAGAVVDAVLVRVPGAAKSTLFNCIRYWYRFQRQEIYNARASDQVILL